MLTALPLSLPIIDFLKVKKISWILFLTLVAFSCLDQPDCYNLTNSTITLAFRKIADGQADTLFILETKLFGSDSAFIDTDTTLLNGALLQLPIDYLTDRTSFSIKEIEKTNLLELGYTVQSQFVSEECGPRFVVSNLSVISSQTDSVRITSATPGSGTNVTVYRCPRTNIVKIAFKEFVSADTIRKDTVHILSTNVTDPITLLYPDTGRVSFLKLPLDLASNTTKVDFVLEESVKTITFQYDLVEATSYAICGIQTFITNLRATTDFANIKLIETTKYKADSIYDPPRINFEIIQ